MKLFANLFKSSQAAAPQAAAGKKAPTTRPLSIEPADPKDSAVLSGIHEKALGEPLNIEEQLKLANAVVLKASRENAPLGFVVLHFGTNSITENPTTLLGSLCVTEEARGQGVGRALTKASLDVAKQAGKSGITLGVLESNPRAQMLYKRLGFNEEKMIDAGGEMAKVMEFQFADPVSQAALSDAMESTVFERSPGPGYASGPDSAPPKLR